MNTRKNALYLGVGLLMGAMGVVRAIEPGPSTGGEVSPVYACFYECKTGSPQPELVRDNRAYAHESKQGTAYSKDWVFRRQ
jgi:hypothetical protein